MKNMLYAPIRVRFQIISNEPSIPEPEDFIYWIQAALHPFSSKVSLMDSPLVTIRVIGKNEMLKLNHLTRKIKKATNVLSFKDEAIPGFKEDSLGELVICAPVIAKEAKEQGKKAHNHWAHITIHGVLHLLGYDHEVADDAIRMENLEISILEKLKIPNPYQV